MAPQRKRTSVRSSRKPAAKRKPASVKVSPVRVVTGVDIDLRPIGQAPAAGARRGVARRGERTGNADVQQALLGALAEQELEATHEFTLAQARTPARRGVSGRKSSQRSGSVALDVDVGPAESAAVLVEQNGEFSWHFPKPVAAAPSDRRGARKRKKAAAASADAPSTLRIEVKLPAATESSGPVRRGIRTGALVSAAKGIVLKFVARTAAGMSIKLLERNVKRGLVVMDNSDPTKWRSIDRLDQLDLPSDRTRKILLFVHGTFSSTVGSFGALGSTADGRALLDEARAKYDAVIGFDHATLSEDPTENAIDLVERLGRFEKPLHIDAVTFSRGGLVLRSLLEQILPVSKSRPELGPVVFVGVPNNGTLLADPENWKSLVDLHTNLAVGAFRLLQLAPQAAPAARILAELTSGMGALVKFLADAVVTEQLVPGLSAQQPGGEFVRKLNLTGAGQPVPDSCRYLAVTSSFDPATSIARESRTGLAGSFVGRLANGLVDRLIKEGNDLVVNAASMKYVDPEAGNFIDSALDFGKSPVVYHTVYFAQPEVARQLRGWLLDDTARTGMTSRHGHVTVKPSPRSPFTRVRFSAGESARRAPERIAQPNEEALAADWDDDIISHSADHHLRQLFGIPRAPSAPAAQHVVAAPGSKPRNYAPTLVAQSMQRSPLSDQRELKVMSYLQTHASIPIFGTRALVELNEAYDMVSSNAKIAKVDGVSPVPSLTKDDALAALARFTKLPPKSQTDLVTAFANAPEQLTFFHDRERDTWHLTYIFNDVPARPPSNGKAASAGARGVAAKRKRVRDRHGMGPSPRQRFPLLDYLVDAHNGSVVYYYSTTPTAAARKSAAKKPAKKSATKRSAARPGIAALRPLPGVCHGLDDEEQHQQFFAQAVGTEFHLVDPQRSIRTFDLGGGDIDRDPLPGSPVSSSSFDFGEASRAGVSAHVNSSHVFNFFNDVLLRRGVDDQGMVLINIVNVVSEADEDPPVWNNAVWWKKRMWYGRAKAGRDKFQSYARHLDIIAHELTHGVTESTSNLVYRDEAGALNESFSDIFGVIINNWVRKGADSDPRTWDWLIGKGLGDKKGAPLRSMKNPGLTGDPAHMKDAIVLAPGELANDDNDYGGVHTNSNIHNKAAYNLLTATSPKPRGTKAKLVLSAREVAQLYYFTLQRLDRVATFEDVLETMLSVAATVFPDPKMRDPRLAAIREAYRKVGIPRE